MATSFRKFLEGLRIVPKTTSTASEQGDLDVTTAAGKLNYHNGTSASPVVTEDHSATLTNKTLTSPVLNTPTADTITGIAGGALQLSSSTGQVVKVEDVSFDSNTVTGGASTLTVQSANNENLSLQAQGTGTVQLESLTVDGSSITGSAATFTVQSASNQQLTVQSQGSGNLSLQAAGTGVVQLESLSIDGNTVTGGASALTLQSASNQNLIVQAQGSGELQLASLTAVTSILALNAQTDAATTGSNATVATPTKSYIQLTNGSLASLDGIPAGVDGQVVVLSNRTGNTIVVNNETGATAANRVLTGTGGAIALDNNASLTLLYNSTASRWMIVGGVGGNLVVNLTAGETLTAGNAIYVSQGAADGGRTAGRVYKLDATNDNRVDFIGFALDSVSSGSAVRVQVGGGLGGLSGLVDGLPVYASVTTPGGLQTAAPTAAGQWIIQVGVATSTTNLVINGSGSATASKIAQFSGSYLNRTSVSSNTILTNNNDVVLVNAAGGGITITLPSPSDGKILYIKKLDSTANIISIIPSAAETIDGTNQKAITGQYDTVELISDGINWYII